MKVIIIVPARWKSSRFPGKPLALINKITMLERVYQQALKSKEADAVYVATDNIKILNFCKIKKIKVIMTSTKCKTGTDRVCEVSKKINADIYVNLQGDEPLIQPNSIDKIIRSIKQNIKHDYHVCTGCAFEDNLKQDKKNSLGFLVQSKNNNVLYVSRSAIPFNYNSQNSKFCRTIGLFAFSKQVLQKFPKMKSNLEKNEKLEILRFLDNDIKIKAVSVKEKIADVNYPSDIKRIEKLLKK